MKKLLLVLAVAVVAAPVANAGGWATVGLSSLPPTGQKPCPLCGKPMSGHTFERSQDHHSTRMHCPV